MSGSVVFLLIIGTITALFFQGKRRAVALVKTGTAPRLNSLPGYYGYCAALWGAVPLFALFILCLSLEPQNYLLPLGGTLLIAGGVYVVQRKLFTADFRARSHVERILMGVFFLASAISVSITLMIVASVLFESIRFFEKVPVTDFLFGTTWSPQTAMRADQAGSTGSFGAVPIFAGTLLITFIAMCVAVPLGLLSAIYLSEYASRTVRAWVKPLLEILAGVPTVVYGYFAAIILAPIVRDFGLTYHIDISTESALLAGCVIGVMVIPFILSLSDDVMNAVPLTLRDASLALGATQTETIKKVIVPAALPGIMGAVLLAISRAIGETMIVVMAAGLSANLTLNPLESVTTVTAQIVTLLVGDQEFDSSKTLSAFALGLTLFVVTLGLNVVSLMIVKKYREQYD
jgi:phosphate transport system permease protein